MKLGITFFEACFGSSFVLLCALLILTPIWMSEKSEKSKKEKQLETKQIEDLQLKRIANSLEALASHTINRQFVYELPPVNYKIIPPTYPPMTPNNSGMASLTLYNAEK